MVAIKPTQIHLTKRQAEEVSHVLSAMQEHFYAEPEECSYTDAHIPKLYVVVLDVSMMNNDSYDDFVYRLDEKADIAEGNNRFNQRTDINSDLQIPNYVPVNVGALRNVTNNVRRKVEKAVTHIPHVKSIPVWEGHEEDSIDTWNRVDS